SVKADSCPCKSETSETPDLYAYPNWYQRNTQITKPAITHNKIPIGLPLLPKFAPIAPNIAGTKAPNSESPIAARDPIKPALTPATVSSDSTPSSSSIAKSIPVTIVLKKLDVLKNWLCVFIASFNSSVLSP